MNYHCRGTNVLRSLVILISLFAVAATDRVAEARDRAELVVSSDFPSGSGELVEIDQSLRRIKLRPTQHAGRGWACWWYVRVEGIQPGEVLTFEVGEAPWSTPRQAVYSTDNKTWRHTAPGTSQGAWMTYEQQVDAPVVWLAWGPPFTLADATELVRAAEEMCDAAQAFELCQSHAGHPVPALHVQHAGELPAFGVWVQARQHAWEAGSSWVCRGFVEWLTSDDPRAERLRRLASFTVVPIMDVDNVVLGAGGKNQIPHDHNRDWSDQPHWPAVARATDELRKLDADNRLDVFLDLHNPDASTSRPFFYVAPRDLQSDLRQRNLDRFLAATRIEMTGPLSFVGEVRESGANYDKQWRQISKNWVTLNSREHVVATTLETAWNTAHSTPDGYKTVGRQLGLALERYLQLDPRGQERKPGQ